jgi:hypothetical protein
VDFAVDNIERFEGLLANGQDQGRYVGPIARALEVEFGQPSMANHRAALSAGERVMIGRLAVAKDPQGGALVNALRRVFRQRQQGRVLDGRGRRALDEVSRASARRFGLRAYPIRFGSRCRCVW